MSVFAAVAPELPAAFAGYEALAARLPQLNREGMLRAAVGALPVPAPEASRLSLPEARRLYVILSYLVLSYLNRDLVDWTVFKGVPAEKKRRVRTVPEALAVPYAAVCRLLSLRPVLCACGADVWNPSAGGIVSFTGSETEAAFHRAPYRMHRRSPAVYEAALSFARGPTPGTATRFCREAEAALRDFIAFFKEELPAVDPTQFYAGYRPLLQAYHPEAEGVRFEGVGTVVAKGPSAGQSVVFLVLDALLGVRHPRSVSAFQEEVLQGYAPGDHVDLLRRCVAAGPVTRLADPSSLSAARSTLAAFRRLHLKIATTYLRATDTGTGNSSFRELLSEALEATEAKL